MSDDFYLGLENGLVVSFVIWWLIGYAIYTLVY